MTLFATVVVASLLAAYSKPVPPKEQIRAVKVMTVGVNTFASGYAFAAEVKAKVESRLGFRMGGKSSSVRLTWVSMLTPGKCWLNWTRKTASWPLTLPEPSYVQPEPIATWPLQMKRASPPCWF